MSSNHDVLMSMLLPWLIVAGMAYTVCRRIDFDRDGPVDGGGLGLVIVDPDPDPGGCHLRISLMSTIGSLSHPGLSNRQ
ncbi:hypothetical protein BDW74DRAFT_3282 [Aspergillus multicolor]|uniref:uncharacterized protein n=1 Tax=Aspergillus multicolor TaxID=41759 RepID=UPI003CCC975B